MRLTVGRAVRAMGTLPGVAFSSGAWSEVPVGTRGTIERVYAGGYDVAFGAGESVVSCLVDENEVEAISEPFVQ